MRKWLTNKPAGKFSALLPLGMFANGGSYLFIYLFIFFSDQQMKSESRAHLG